MKITVEAKVAAPIEQVWKAWMTPSDITRWNAASDDWHTTTATVDLRVGGSFSSRMQAKDGSVGFDFGGIYTRVVERELIKCSMGDRSLLVEFIDGQDGVVVRETFDAETTHSEEQQRQAGRLFWIASRSTLRRSRPSREPSSPAAHRSRCASSSQYQQNRNSNSRTRRLK